MSGDDEDDALSFVFESAPLPWDDDDNVLASSPSIGAVFEGNRESDDNDCWFKFEFEYYIVRPLLLLALAVMC